MNFAATLVFVTISSCMATDSPGVPKIVEASPKFWDTNVNPENQKQISITFDQTMSPAHTAWLGRSSLPPDINLESSSMAQDRRTFQIEVGLEAGKVYVFALNEKVASGVGFQNEKAVPALPHYLVFQTSGDPAPDDVPPRVTNIVPADESKAIDPAKVQAITVTFDKPMQTAKHGLHLSENNTPVDLSKARFEYSPDKRTFVLYYDFKPSTAYRLELNNVNDIGFTSANRIPLWPVRISFATGTPQ